MLDAFSASYRAAKASHWAAFMGLLRWTAVRGEHRTLGARVLRTGRRHADDPPGQVTPTPLAAGPVRSSGAPGRGLPTDTARQPGRAATLGACSSRASPRPPRPSPPRAPAW